MQFNDWCDWDNAVVGDHFSLVMTVKATDRDAIVQRTAAIILNHYAAEENIARTLKRLGKTAAASLIEEKLPTTKAIRSGDLGEIYAMEWINAYGYGYQVPIKKLRWKDHRNMAMRGEDVIGFHLSPQTQQLSFLKTEAKSRVSLTTRVVEEARVGLDKDGGLPSVHSLLFISERLLEIGDEVMADAIEDAALKHGIPAASVQHLMFTFSGNSPQPFLSASLQAYAGGFNQWAVGLRVDAHSAFIGAVYDQVIINANT